MTIRKTIIPTRAEVFIRKRCLGILINLIVTYILAGLTFLLFAFLLSSTSVPENIIRPVSIITGILAPIIGCGAGAFFHAKSLYKRDLIRTKREAITEEVKNSLIAIF